MREMKLQHIVLLFTIYITQYIGLGFFTEAFIAILRKDGVSLENLGLVYMLGIFWILRFLWAPLIDKYSFKKYGHYKVWLFIFQGIMTFILVLTSFFDIRQNLNLIIISATFFAFFSASQNIAADALMYKTLSNTNRSIGNAIKISGGLIGALIGGGLGLISYYLVGWKITFFFMALFTLFVLIQLIFIKEQDKEEKVEVRITFKDYIKFWKEEKRTRWLGLILIVPATISGAYAIITPLLVDKGWALEKIGLIVHIFGYAIGVFASFLVPFTIKKLGKKKTLIIACTGQSIGILLLLFPINDFLNDYLIIAIVGFIFMFYTPMATIISTLMMDQISNKNHTASQYAIQHSLYSLAGIVFASASISLSGVFGYVNMALTYFFIGLITIILATQLDKIIPIKEENII